MMTLKHHILRGYSTPSIAPFRDGGVDFKVFGELVDRQAREGSHGVVVAGPTGEPSSLTIQERKDLLRAGLEGAAGRLPVVAATGSQSYVETAELTRHAEEAGAHAVLVVTPYYIKPPQQGLVDYFVGIGRLTSLPLLIYHIPRRAAVSIAASAVSKIAEAIPNLVG